MQDAALLFSKYSCFSEDDICMNYIAGIFKSEGHFSLGGIVRVERHFLLFKYQLEERERGSKDKKKISIHAANFA